MWIGLIGVRFMYIFCVMLKRIWMGCWYDAKCGATADDDDHDDDDDDVDERIRQPFISFSLTLSFSAAPEYRKKDCG